MKRISVAAAAASILLIAVGCAADTEDGDSNAQPSASPSRTLDEPTSATSTDPSPPSPTVDYPVPPGAREWPIKDIEACSDLGAVTEPQLVVRVPVATPDCIKYSEASEVLVIATGEIEASIGPPEKVDVPGFDGDVQSIRSSISQGVAYAVEPSDEDAKYLVLWDGGTSLSIAQILNELFVTQ